MRRRREPRERDAATPPRRHRHSATAAPTQVFNTAAATAVGTCECPTGSDPGGNFTAIYNGTDLKLRDVAGHDYRPSADSPLVDAGAIISPYTDGFSGAAPDIGAYESDGEFWQAGCVGLAGC